MDDTELPPWSAAEKFAAVLGLVLAAGLAVVMADVLTGGRLLKLLGCGCGEEQASEAEPGVTVA